jgi:hypothetical protein
MAVQVPNNAVAPGSDLLPPAQELLRGLYLLSDKPELERAGQIGSAFGGPPQSVALIEAGATSAAKWWSAGAGATIVATWGSVIAWWGDQETNIKSTVIWAAGIVTAALALAVGYLLGSDVRGRASAMTATIEARETVAIELVRAAVAAFEPEEPQGTTLVGLPALEVKLTTQPSGNEAGWRAVALERESDGTLKYVVVKGSAEHRVRADELAFG